jgi:hypothetical protein
MATGKSRSTQSTFTELKESCSECPFMDIIVFRLIKPLVLVRSLVPQYLYISNWIQQHIPVL